MVPEFALVIPTYKRPHLLQELIDDVTEQTWQPCELIVVDGDPDPGHVLAVLHGIEFPDTWHVTYVSSAHPNAPFQRYLGVSSIVASEVVVFVDDDIRLKETTVLERILVPFTWQDRCIAGISPRITFPRRTDQKAGLRGFVRGNYWHAKPGEITPTGNRIDPVYTGEDYVPVRWLRGGAMAYRLSLLLPVIYDEDVFALSYIRCGLGVDDTILSRAAGAHGELLLACCTQIIHPDSDSSRAYPIDPYHLAYARAYSRRFINDHFRASRPPTLHDRMALVVSLIGNTLICWMWAAMRWSKIDAQYARGYMYGTLRALVQKPIASKLAPGVNWQDDARKSLSTSMIIQKSN